MSDKAGEYQSLRTQTPPILRQRDGRWFIVTCTGNLEIEAPIGPWFAAEFLSKVVAPAVGVPSQPNQESSPHASSRPYLPPYDR